MNCESTEAILKTYITPAGDDINEDVTEEIDEQELPCSDFYTYKSEIIDTEIVVPGSTDHLDKELEVRSAILISDLASNSIFFKQDVLVKNEDNEEIITDLIEDTKPPPKTKKESTKEKTSRAKRNAQADKDQERIHICEICANQYKYRHALEVHMRR